MSAAVLHAREPGAAYTVGLDFARSVHLYRLYQSRTYEGAVLGRGGREADRRLIERAFAFARQHLRFRGTPQLVPGRTAAPGADRLPDILCIGEFVWGRPVHSRAKSASSATLVWFQDSFAPPIDPAVQDNLREVNWAAIAEDWD